MEPYVLSHQNAISPDQRVGGGWSASRSRLGGTTSGHVERGKRVLPNPDGSAGEKQEIATEELAP